MKKQILFILAFAMTLNLYSQVKIDDTYIIIHPNFEIGDKRIVTETTYQSIEKIPSTLESMSTVKQLVEITNRTKSNFEISFNFIESNLNSYDEKLKQYYEKSNLIEIQDVSEIKLKLNKWGYYDSLSYVNLTTESLNVFESNCIKFAEWLDSNYSQDSLAFQFNYKEKVGEIILDRNYKKNDITEILYNIAILPVAFYDRIIPLESESFDSIESGLTFIEGDLVVVNNKKHKLQNGTFELINNNKFIIPESKYPIDYYGTELTHLEWEENQTYIIEKESGWPILKRTEIIKVFNDETQKDMMAYFVQPHIIIRYIQSK